MYDPEYNARFLHDDIDNAISSPLPKPAILIPTLDTLLCTRHTN